MKICHTVLINLWKGGWWNLDPPKTNKIYNKLLLNHNVPAVDPMLSNNQSGFSKGRFTISHMLSLRHVIEKMKRLNKEFTICFVDFQLSWWSPFISEKWTLWDALCYLWLIICSLIFVFVLQFSKELTGVFVQMGQSPVLKVKVGHRFVSWDEWKIFNKSYITNEGWETTQDISH